MIAKLGRCSPTKKSLHSIMKKEKKKKNFTSFGQPTRLITCEDVQLLLLSYRTEHQS